MKAAATAAVAVAVVDRGAARSALIADIPDAAMLKLTRRAQGGRGVADGLKGEQKPADGVGDSNSARKDTGGRQHSTEAGRDSTRGVILVASIVLHCEALEDAAHLRWCASVKAVEMRIGQ